VGGALCRGSTAWGTHCAVVCADGIATTIMRTLINLLRTNHSVSCHLATCARVASPHLGFGFVWVCHPWLRSQPRLLRPSEVDALLDVRGNHTCADCAAGGMSLAGSGKKQRPLWASVNLGVVLSVQAAGRATGSLPPHNCPYPL
jgi:hypothetical protein